MSFTMLTGGDWRDASSAQIDTLVSFINSSNVDLFVGLGDYSQWCIQSRVTVPAKWVKGNHDSSTSCDPYFTGIYNWNGIQLLSGGYGSTTDTSLLNPIDTTKLSMYFQHVNFIDGCAGAHGNQNNSAMRLALNTKTNLIGGGCGHNHNYAFGGPSDRTFMQTGTQPNIRYCGPATWTFGYWLFDDSVSGQLTVKYAGVDVVNTFPVPTTWDKVFTVNVSGGGGGGGVVGGISWWDRKTCFGSTCIDNKILAIGGGVVLLLLLTKKR